MATTMAHTQQHGPTSAPGNGNGQTISPAPSFSPSSSVSTTPSTSSPASPRSSQTLPNGTHHHQHQHQHHAHPATRQLRPPKSPMYIPAALRPTERPARPAPKTSASNSSRPSNPPTPPHSAHSSSAESLSSRPTTPSARPTISTSLKLQTQTSNPSTSTSTPTTPAPGLSTTPSSPTSSLHASLSSPASAAPHPTRLHWKPDAAAAICDEPACATTFSLLQRRHHCRRCGGVFCGVHSAESVPLDVDAEFDVNGGWWRACGVCGGTWRRRLEEGQRGVGLGMGSVEVGRSQALEVGGKTGKGGAQVVVASAPKDWNWSTF